MKFHLVTAPITDLEQTVQRSVWCLSKAEAASARQKLVEDGAMRKDLRTYEIDVPTTKRELQQFLGDLGGGDVSLLVATRKLLAE